MKKSAEIKGLPIISIMDGSEIGRVKSLIINPDQGTVDFFTIEHEEWQVGGKAIPFKKVIGIGEYALTIENEGAIIDLNEIPIASDLLNRKTKIENTKLMTRKGQLIGEAKEYVIDDETGKIVNLEVKVQGDMMTLDHEFVVTYGKDIIIVTEEAGTHLHSIEAEQKPAGANGLAAIEQQQDELLKGKTVRKDIIGMNREVLISQGTVLNEQSIRTAREAGPEVFVELSMNVE
ncbi:PRC-barrel domain-containing protein [Pseudobacillus wudalianchiensis]|uniref:Photosystem reaction center subunit H n=1 Tax=Pseudobacillus wudalianchiensis TaxID=1743143 RepID=A0A1B9B8H7_9BACI|nr:PRC-barrel domain-containing protein [Bacillus wudalianchiensis]OCA92395.1 photosystem reaction center subunit H [Bacillus wudalianchiensis]